MMTYFKNFIQVLIVAGLTAVSVPVVAKKPPELAPLELQALQSKEFETTKENLFSAVMTVVQDTGYQVQSADLQTGFITAVSAVQQKTGFIEALAGVQSQANTKMTAYLQALPNGMARVRLNFMFSKSMSSKYGQSTNEKPVLDAAVYRNAWDKIDEALFVAGALEAPKKKADEANAPAKTTP
jgi:hypothetical protein